MGEVKKAKKVKISISVDADVLEKTMRLAEQEDRVLSNYINYILKLNIDRMENKQ